MPDKEIPEDIREIARKTVEYVIGMYEDLMRHEKKEIASLCSSLLSAQERIKELEWERGWISVEDRLPEDNTKVIFFTRGYSTNEMKMGTFLKIDHFGRENIFCSDGFFKLENISHWRLATTPPTNTDTVKDNK